MSCVLKRYLDNLYYIRIWLYYIYIFYQVYKNNVIDVFLVMIFVFR